MQLKFPLVDVKKKINKKKHMLVDVRNEMDENILLKNINFFFLNGFKTKFHDFC